ncbi:MAG: hypothetical protein HQK79_04210 [Desulfobacterales bacterium]|nr:hypothetical protein [Desulfobacterales bacterium]MBF0398845.1 hypothetical protein [Desulfobacterales bacterium]
MKKCLYFHFWADIDTSPTQMEIIRSLIQNNFQIDLIHETRDFLLPPDFPKDSVKCFAVSSWKNCAKETIEFIDEQQINAPYSFIIAVDMQGLYVALPHSKRFNIPLIYLSCELTFMDELTNEEDIRLKKIEIQGTRIAQLIIIQDEERGNLLAKENSLPMGKFIYLPNSPKDNEKVYTNNYLRKKLFIPAGKKIVLHAGSFDTWTHGEELLSSALKWDDQFVLVIHTRHIPQSGDFVSENINRYFSDKIFFSTHPLPYDKYGEIISSSDIGLVLYKQSPTKYTQKNLYHIGLSSGKFSYFARHGKPVIASDLPSYQKIFKHYNNGLCIPDIQSINDALLYVEKNLSKMGHNNRQFYENNIDIKPFINKLLQSIRKIIQ